MEGEYLQDLRNITEPEYQKVKINSEESAATASQSIIPNIASVT